MNTEMYSQYVRVIDLQILSKGVCVHAREGLALSRAWNAGDVSHQADLAVVTRARQRQSFSRTLLSQKLKSVE
jgi:hypothetical protein